MVAAGTGVVASVRSPFPIAMDTPTFGRARRPRGRGRAGVSFFAFLVEFALVGALVGLVAISRFVLDVGTLPGALGAVLAGAAWWSWPWLPPPAICARTCPRRWLPSRPEGR
jgi:hypothetical protein